MRVTGAKLTTVRIPLQTPFVTALRRVESAEAVRLWLESDSGAVGIGEAPPTEKITGETMESIERAIRDTFLPALRQTAPAGLPQARDTIAQACRGHRSAKAAVDIALSGLFGLFTPPAAAEPVTTAVTVSLDAPDAMERQAVGFYRKGCTLLKVKLGGSIEEDLSRLRRIREALPDATLLADANQAWHTEEALRFLDLAYPLRPALLEQPLPAADLKGMRRITAKSPIPILADESAFTLEEVKRVVESEAAHMINVKLMKCGGVGEAEAILQWCKAHGIACMMGSMLETPASIRAALWLAMRYRDTIRYCDLDSPLLWKNVPEDSGIAIDRNRLNLRDRTDPPFQPAIPRHK
ncbi:dipeptide epimerase [Hydrogenimonas sp. SS33]|uniref:dipeptide epimerase n=1 Tax=Hydrogenimonas leucolamina TaxID=2954236 RepID=UPI00336BBA93